MRPTALLAPVLLLASSTIASAWQPFNAAKRDITAPALEVREPATSYDLSYSSEEGNTATITSAASTDSAEGPTPTATQTGNGSGSSGQISASGSNSASGSGSKGSGSATGSSKSSKTTSTYVSIDPQAPAGGVQMITPSAIAAASYYKIKDYATFAWNYTSLSVTPSAVDVLASCSQNSATYTLALNQSISGPSGAVTWDTGAYQATATIPLLTGKYTLIIHDASKDIDATASPGYLSTFNQFTFGMYSPQPFTPVADYICATCSGAMSSMEKQTMGFMFGMVAVTVLSFSWFAGVAGLW